jgi:hypothetical protein
MHANAYKTKPGRITSFTTPPFQKARLIFVDILVSKYMADMWLN